MTLEVWQALLFSLHLWVVADLPPEYGIYVWRAAQEQERVEPYELGALLISEKSGQAMDFSVVGSLLKGAEWRWDTRATGELSERGLFQLAANWAFVFGVEVEELFDPETSARVAAFVVARNKESHDRCVEQRYNAHTWAAHWKCGTDEEVRNQRKGQCRFAQRKLWKVEASLRSFWGVDLRAIGKLHNKWVRSVHKRKERDRDLEQRKQQEAQNHIPTQDAGD